MTVDISALGQLQPVEQIDLDNYADAQEARPLPKKGVYTVRAPETFPATAFSSTKAGYLSAQIDPTIVGPTNDGFQIRFSKVSAKTFKRNNLTVSQLGDYLRACGRKGPLSTDPGKMADAVAETANAIYQIAGDWRVYEKATGYKLEGMERFPSDGKGSHSPWTPSPTEKDPDTGEPVMLRAQFVITRYIPAA